MFKRRTVLAGLAATAASTTIARAAVPSWAEKYPELVFAVIPAENASGVTERWGSFIDYLTKRLGTKVTLRIANDYAAVIEGQRAGNIQVGYYGPASLSRALMTGVPITAFAIDVNSDGTKGYHSVFYVMKDSPYKDLQDLKGKNLGLVDPNSTSGYNMPLYTLDKRGIDPKVFFDKIQVTGSHENAILALVQGTVQTCANWWNAPDDSNLTRMLNKGMIKAIDGKPARVDDFRIVLESDLIINSPYAYLNSLPEDLKSAIRQAFLDAVKDAPEAFARLSDGKNKPWETIGNADYDDTIKMLRYVDKLRKA